MSRQIPPRLRDAIFRITRICEILFSFLSGSITIVSYGTAFWYVNVSEGLHAGLWQKCVGNPSHCVGVDLVYSGLQGNLRAAQALMSLALVAAILASVVSLISSISHRWQFLLVSSISLFVEAVLLMIGLAVFANILSNMELSHSVTAGWSFYIAWLALLIAFSGAIYFGGVTIYSYKFGATRGSVGEDRRPFIRATQLVSLRGEPDILCSDGDTD